MMMDEATRKLIAMIACLKTNIIFFFFLQRSHAGSQHNEILHRKAGANPLNVKKNPAVSQESTVYGKIYSFFSETNTLPIALHERKKKRKGSTFI